MKKILSGVCALAMLATSGMFVPAMATPAGSAMGMQGDAGSNVIRTQAFTGDLTVPGRRWDRGNHLQFRDYDRDRPRYRHRDRDRYSYYRGHRGYRDYRPGYRRHNGFWFPAAAFITGAIVGGAIANSNDGTRVRSYGSAHVDWCYDRYRSYRASDNTFQPYNGPRRQCFSPYS